MNLETVRTAIVGYVAYFGLKVLGALAVLIIGRWLIGLAVRLVERALTRQQVDPTLLRYVGNIVTVVLNIALIIGILGYFGVETTSFAAVLAAAGVAIGLAWSGLLANFAAGAFLIVLRPFKVGDFVTAGGVTGTVKEIGLFATTMHTPDNIETYIGNNKIFTDTIQNFSATPYRRVDRVAKLHESVDHKAAINLLKTRVSQIPNVLQSPPPEVDILDLAANGPVLAVRPYCTNSHYWQVYFDTNRVIRESFDEAGYPAPEQVMILRNEAKTAA